MIAHRDDLALTHAKLTATSLLDFHETRYL